MIRLLTAPFGILLEVFGLASLTLPAALPLDAALARPKVELLIETIWS